MPSLKKLHPLVKTLYLFIWGFTSLSTLQVISRRVFGKAEETSTYSSLGFCTVNCRPTASNYQLSHLRPCRGSNPGLRGGSKDAIDRQTCRASGPFHENSSHMQTRGTLNQGHIKTLHTYNPQPMSLPSINLLHLTVSEI